MIEKLEIKTLSPLIFLLVCLISIHSQEQLTNKKKITQFLTRNHYDYQLDNSGDFIIRYTLDSGRTQAIYILSTLNTAGNTKVRDIFSLAAPLNSDWPASFYRKLLAENYSTRFFGGWAVSEGDNNSPDFLIYLSKIPADFDDAYLAAVLHDTAESADSMEKLLTQDSDRY